MKELLRMIAARARVILFFVWTYTVIDLLARGRYLTFLRPEFGIVLAVALVMFIALVFAEISRDSDDGLHWYELQRPLILMLPLLFLMNAQGASLDYYTFGKRFTGTAGMAVDIEPSAASNRPSAPAGRSDDVPSSLNPSGRDRLRFNQNWNSGPAPQPEAGMQPIDASPATAPATSPATGNESGAPQPGPHVPGTLSASARPAGDNDDEQDDGSTPDVLETTTTQLYETPRLYEGKLVSVIGMVDANEDVARQFGERAKVLFRFMIACCAADAQPIAVVFETKQAFRVQGENVWFRVIGRYTLEKKDGRTIPVIRDATASTIPRPKNEYLY